ncbi:MAG: sortase [Anaerolineales bacterium]|nr:sortase [Anaerolineales bacterium]
MKALKIILNTFICTMIITCSLSVFTIPASADDSDTLIGIPQNFNFSGSDSVTADEFGYAIDVSGDYAVVSAPYKDSSIGLDPKINTGAVYVFKKDDTGWVEEAKLVASNADAGDVFGISVAIDGTTIAVGATGFDRENSAGETIDNVGAVYVFSLIEDEWEQTACLYYDDAEENEALGTSVDIDGNTIIAGASTATPNNIPDAGRAFIYIGNKNFWFLQTVLTLPPAGSIGAFFGSSVAISGNVAAVGALEAGGYLGEAGSGAVYLYKRYGGNTWQAIDTLKGKDRMKNDFFGSSLDIQNGRLIVGAPLKDPEINGRNIANGGEIYIFDEDNNGNWKETAAITSPAPQTFENFGSDVAIYGNTLLVGASGKNVAGATRSGGAYLYKRSDGIWLTSVFLYASNPEHDENFGDAVSLNDEFYFVGSNGSSPDYMTNAGEVFLYQEAYTLPETGFAPNQVTEISLQPNNLKYLSVENMVLDIPGLGVSMDILSVPKENNRWDTTWLWNNAGYLSGTAYPTTAGNTAIAAHVYLPDGSPGPFVDLAKLSWGDRLFIISWGNTYIYEVRQVYETTPTNSQVLADSDYDQLTLITCKGYNEFSDSYAYRTVVQAVLVEIQ